MGLELLILANLGAVLLRFMLGSSTINIIFVIAGAVLNCLLLYAHHRKKLNGIITVLLSSCTVLPWLSEPIGLILAFFPIVFIIFGGVQDHNGNPYIIGAFYRICIGIYTTLVCGIYVYVTGFHFTDVPLFLIALLITVYFGENYRQSVIKTTQTLRYEALQAQKDKLTGLLTRESMSTAIENEAKKINDFSIIMMDIDNFKSVNDTYGHTQGDNILSDLAQAVQASIRQQDKAFRYGGEEFLVLCPGTSMDNAVNIAERIRKKFNEKAYYIDGDTAKHFSVSLGVAESKFETFTDTISLIKQADDALYYSKQHGKNQVTPFRH